MLVYEPEPAPARGRATVSFELPGHAPLTIVVEAVHETSWGFLRPPELRVPWHFAGLLRAVHFASVHSFESGGKRLRVEVTLEGSSSLALEGESVTIGPVAMDAPPQAS